MAPVNVQRVATDLSDSQAGAVQVQELAVRNPRAKVVVEDSLYGNHVFLAIFLAVKNVFALVRLRSNLVFYEALEPHPQGKPGAPAKHEAKFKLSAPARPPDQSDTFLLGEQTVTLQAWQGCISRSWRIWWAWFCGSSSYVQMVRPDTNGPCGYFGPGQTPHL